MLNKYKAKREEGFTIIEVLIVLAIAGLIMVIVFIAVPQLQRNQRNEARSNDARLLATAVSECLGNRNGVHTACQAKSADAVNLPTNLNQITAANMSYNAATGDWPSDTTSAIWSFGAQCDAEGDGVVTTSITPRQYVVKYNVDGGNGNVSKRCISG